MKHMAPILSAILLASGGSALAASSCPPGFAMLQSSDTCVRIGGRVRADTILRSGTRKKDTVSNQASGRVQLDVRKQTEYGPVRAFIRVQGVQR
ncbi:porin [Microvirga guangxiensis]|uniref:Porin n=1 Tax=Microvirga guangxiensis TaxID=549386 RepID=A0A1G5B188_9HYPH|nr:porin [Microvirga guangxiensis]SCX83874.1 Porin subfamily protein [Microvirga guangxiensis]